MIDDHPKIKVIIRKRPLNKKEMLRNDKDIVTVGAKSVAVREEKLKVDLTKYTEEYLFNFDAAYDESTTNPELYEESVKPLIESAFQGAKITCFAYGQTGSGKTYTMLGSPAHHIPGLYLLAGNEIFNKITKSGYDKLSIWVSFYEIYCGKLFDLLNDRNILFARQDAKQNVNIVGLQEKKVVSLHNLMQLIEYGGTVRITAQNSANNDSSRSHAILQISIKEGNKLFGKMSFIDLAGSERGADHADESKQTRIDGAEINKSLLALKQCIRALDQNQNHTPFRGSKLTMVLKDSFTGYCKSLMIGNISPSHSSCENTLNTLKYADRVKELKKSKEEKDYDEMMLPRNRKVPKEQDLLVNQNHNSANRNKIVDKLSRDEQPRVFVPQPIKHDMTKMAQRHEQLINLIISEEEELCQMHKDHIIDSVEMTKQQGHLLKQAEQINTDTHGYINTLDDILAKKQLRIKLLQNKIASLKHHLAESQHIEKTFNQQRANQYKQESLLADLHEDEDDNRLFE